MGDSGGGGRAQRNARGLRRRKRRGALIRCFIVRLTYMRGGVILPAKSWLVLMLSRTACTGPALVTIRSGPETASKATCKAEMAPL